MGLINFFDSLKNEYRHGVFIGNLAWWTTAEDIMDAYSNLDIPALGVKIIEDQCHGCSIGFGTLGLATEELVEKALKYIPQIRNQDDPPTVLKLTFNNFTTLLDEAKASGRCRSIEPKRNGEKRNSAEKDDEDKRENTSIPVQTTPTPQVFTQPYNYNYNSYNGHQYRRYSPYTHPHYRYPRPHYQSAYARPRHWINPIITQDIMAKNFEKMNVEFVVRQNKSVTSTAIKRSVELLLDGSINEAKNILLTAIATVEESEASADERCHVLAESLKETLRNLPKGKKVERSHKMHRTEEACCSSDAKMDEKAYYRSRYEEVDNSRIRKYDKSSYNTKRDDTCYKTKKDDLDHCKTERDDGDNPKIKDDKYSCSRTKKDDVDYYRSRCDNSRDSSKHRY